MSSLRQLSFFTSTYESGSQATLLIAGASTTRYLWLFYLLIYGILENEKLSQRTLEDTFNDPVFKLLFDLKQEETVCRSSISERLGKIDSDYFRQIYECIYEQYSTAYIESDQHKHNIIHVDSSIVTDTAGKLSLFTASILLMNESVI